MNGPLLAAIVTWCCFSLRLVPHLSWLDGGELALAALSLGTAHPPGEGGWIVPAHLAGFAPLGDGFSRLSWFSTACASAAAAAFTAFVGVLLKEVAAASPTRGWTALCSGIAFGGCEAMALQAVRPEVYALWAALFAVAWWSSIAWGARGAALAVLAQAWAGSVHPLLVVAAAPISLTWMLVSTGGIDGRSIRRRAQVVLGAAAILVGPALGLLALPVLRDDPAGPLPFGPEPGTSWIPALTGAAYGGSFRLGPDALLRNLETHVALLWGGLTPLPLVLAAAGCFLGPLRHGSRVALLLGVVAGVAPTVLQGVFTASNPDAIAYLLVPVAAGLTLAAGAIEWRGAGGGGALVRRAVAGVWAAQIVAGGILATPVGEEPAAGPLARAALDLAPLGAVLLPEGDSWSLPTLYLHRWEGRRPDLLVQPFSTLRTPRFALLLAGVADREGWLTKARDHGSRAPFVRREWQLRVLAAALPGAIAVTDAALPPELHLRRRSEGPWLRLDHGPVDEDLDRRFFDEVLAPLCRRGGDARLAGISSRLLHQRVHLHESRGSGAAADRLLALAPVCVPDPWDIIHLVAHEHRQRRLSAGSVASQGPNPWSRAAGVPPGADGPLADAMNELSNPTAAEQAATLWALVLSGDEVEASRRLGPLLATAPTEPLAHLLAARLRPYGLAPESGATK